MAIQVQVKRPVTHSLKIAIATIAVFLCVGLIARFWKPLENTQHGNQWHVYFSPDGGCAEAIVQELAKAKDTVFVQAYSFTSDPIAKALAEAQKRGVAVSVIFDQSQLSEPNSEANFLSHSGIHALVDGAHALNHNKVMIIDNSVVITGSFNFTTAAEEKNAENLLIIEDKTLAQRYTENWYLHSTHSKPLP